MNSGIGFDRRNFLYGLSSTLGTVALNSLLNAEEQRKSGPLVPKPPHHKPKAKACIFLFMEGGPSHLDTFDPKEKLKELHLKEFVRKDKFVSAMASGKRYFVASPFKFQKAGKSGIDFCEHYKHLAGVADDLCVYRGCVGESINHPTACYHMNTGNRFGGDPAVGSWTTYGLGTENQNLPAFIVLPELAFPQGGSANWSNGFLSSIYRGVSFRNQGEPLLNLKNPPGVSRNDRRDSLAAIRELNRQRLELTKDSKIAERIAAYELAFRMQAAAPELIDLSGETQQTLDNYGIDRPEPINQRFRGYTGNAHAAFGRNCLLARRLVERGVRFVNLYHASWDHHDGLDKDLKYNCSVVDQPVAALLKDLKQRGLLDDTLVVFTGEFGRTPLADTHERKGQQAGRDHHPFAFSLWMAGGGVKGGQVVGKTDELGWAPVEDPVHINDFHATLLHLFGLNHLRLSKRFGGFDIRLTNVGGTVVEKLIS